MGQDIFGKTTIAQRTPITADNCQIIWDDLPVTQAVQLSVGYNQSITRRRSIGNKAAIIYGSQPSGQITISRLLVADAQSVFGTASWTCAGGKVQFTTGSCNGGASTTYIATGCIVSSYNIQAQAEDLTVIDSVTIDFLQLEETTAPTSDPQGVQASNGLNAAGTAGASVTT